MDNQVDYILEAETFEATAHQIYNKTDAASILEAEFEAIKLAQVCALISIAKSLSALVMIQGTNSGI